MSEPASRRPGVLFVCLGNICRSPAGEGYLRHLARERRVDSHIDIDSAGTIGYHAGSPADPRMRRASQARGYSLDSIARQVESEDFRRFDLIVAMDRENLADLRAMSRSCRSDEGADADIRLLSDFLPEPGSQREARTRAVDVPDPYHGGARGFEQVLDLIEAASPQILDHLLALGHAKSRAAEAR